ncbi:MAG: universal stress protein [Afipia sp.]|nr:universal stress protein [Afipia sp.]
MYKNLLVHIPTERSARPVIDGSVSLTKALDASLEAIAIGYVHFSNVSVIAEGGTGVAAIFEVEEARAAERASAALAVFEAEAKLAKIRYKCRPESGTLDEATDILGSAGRLNDLTIVSQPEPGQRLFDNILAQEILFQSGGPVLIMPYTFEGNLKVGHIGICWDGSRAAARSLHDAMPLLRTAKKLSIVTVNGAVAEEVSPARLVGRLADQGLTAQMIAVQSERSAIQPTILSVAADEGCDLLVMGGYGHSRFKETVLGGVTRDMFRSMTVPTLMSH